MAHYRRNITSRMIWMIIFLHHLHHCDAVYRLKPYTLSKEDVEQLRPFSKVFEDISHIFNQNPTEMPFRTSLLHPVARYRLHEIISLLKLNDDNACLERIRRKPLSRRRELLRAADYLDMTIAPAGRRSFFELVSDMYVKTLTKTMRAAGNVENYRRTRAIHHEEYLFSLIVNALPNSSISSPSSCNSCVELLPYLTDDSITRIYRQALELARNAKNRKAVFFPALRLIVAMSEQRFKIRDFDLFDKAIILLKIRTAINGKHDDSNNDIRTLCKLVKCFDETWTESGTLTLTVLSWLQLIFMRMSILDAASANKPLLQACMELITLIICRIHRSHFSTISLRGLSLLDSAIESMFVSYRTSYNLQTPFGIDVLSRIIDRTPTDILHKYSDGRTSLCFLLKSLWSHSDGKCFKSTSVNWITLIVQLLSRKPSKKLSISQSLETLEYFKKIIDLKGPHMKHWQKARTCFIRHHVAINC